MTASERREHFIKSNVLPPCLYLQHPPLTLRWTLTSWTKLPSPLTLSMKATISTFHLSFLDHHYLALHLVQSRIILWVVGEHGLLVGLLFLLVVCGVLTLPPLSNWSMDDPIVLCWYGKHIFIFHSKHGSHHPPSQTSAFGVFQDYYTSTYMPNSSASAISWIGGVQIFLELILGPIGGWLYVHPSRKSIHWLTKRF